MGKLSVSPSARGRIHAFTLIELLIVVAIIAILAAIAVPNFLEAQTRAKVSRVVSDLRVFDMAAETYRIDHNKTPLSNRSAVTPALTRLEMFKYLTTPIQYINAALPDAFNKLNPPDDRYLVSWGNDYLFSSNGGKPDDAGRARWGPGFKNFPQYSDGTKLTRTNFFFMFSLGPDQKFDVLDPVFISPIYEYDASNGTISKGDLVRFNG